MNLGVPENMSLLSPNCFKLHINRIPHTIFFLQSVNLPPLISGQISFQAGRTFEAKYPGDTLNVGEVTCQVLLDEDMKTYKEIQEWMVFNATNNGSDGVVSDASLSILTNNHNANHEIYYHRMFPTSMSEINLRTVDSPENPLTFLVTFAFEKYEFKAGKL